METKEISQNTNPLESESIGKLILTHSESIVRILQLGVASGANQLAITLVQINFQSQRYFSTPLSLASPRVHNPFWDTITVQENMAASKKPSKRRSPS